jgi:restriction system protein
VGDIASFVCAKEGREELSGPAVSIAVRRENERLERLGEPAAFRCYPEGEEWGWVALTGQPTADRGHGIDDRIRERNRRVVDELREQLSRMDWRVFESTFLTQVLEALGFEEVEITQASRDGGVDARVTYQRGLVSAQAIVSAKHWKNRVPVDEVRKVRGIKGREDTAIIITTSSFSADARKEAEPGQNQRAVYLIDGQRIVDICRSSGIGVRKVPLPELLAIDEESFGPPAEQATPRGREELAAPKARERSGRKPKSTRRSTRARESVAGRRLRLEMLGDSERGLSAAEIAKLTGLGVGSVRTYLSSPERTQDLFERLRTEHRERALRIVAKKRS